MSLTSYELLTNLAGSHPPSPHLPCPICPTVAHPTSSDYISVCTKSDTILAVWVAAFVIRLGKCLRPRSSLVWLHTSAHFPCFELSSCVSLVFRFRRSFGCMLRFYARSPLSSSVLVHVSVRFRHPSGYMALSIFQVFSCRRPSPRFSVFVARSVACFICTLC